MTGSIETTELECVVGLEAIVIDEIGDRLGDAARRVTSPRPGVLQLEARPSVETLIGLGTPTSAYRQTWMPIERPSELLHGQAQRRLLDIAAEVIDHYEYGSFSTFRLSAAGAETPVMREVRRMIETKTGLREETVGGHLLIRLRRPLDRGHGWDVLARVTPRPLSAREWRVCNYPGALDSTVARCMARLGRPSKYQRVLNVGCGSATLLVERRAEAPARWLVGCDTDPDVLRCGRENLDAAGLSDVELAPWDARAVPVPDRTFDLLLADLPYGQRVGTHDRNVQEYPELLREAGRITRSGGRFVLVTHESRLAWRAIQSQQSVWRVAQEWPIQIPFERGLLHPRIFVLVRIPRRPSESD